jgi:hypothetical protein
MKSIKKAENILCVVLAALAVNWGFAAAAKLDSWDSGSGNSSPRVSGGLTLPSLAGTPYEALSRAESWIQEFKKEVIQNLNDASAGIQGGQAPDGELKTLDGRLASNKQIIASTNGLTGLLIRQEQKMASQIKDVEKMMAEEGTDGPMKQQYAYILSGARKSLESYRICRANVEILGKKIDSAMASVVKWRQFYKSTSGITGAETAAGKLSEMIKKVRENWEE